MNILMIATLYKPYRLGGAEVVFNHIVDELKKEHTVSILTSAPWNGFRSLRPTRTEEDGVVVYRFYPLNLFWFIDFLKKLAIIRLFWHGLDMVNLHSYFITRSVIRHVKPDVVMTHNIKGIGYTIPRAIRSMKVPHVHTLQDIQLFNPSGLVLYGEERHLKNANIFVSLYTALCRWLFASPSMIVFSSQYLRDTYARRGFFPFSTIVMIPNPLASSFFDAPLTIKEKRAPIVFAYIGQIDQSRGAFFLAEAFRKFSPPDASLWFIGGGDALETVRSLTASDGRIRFFGAQPNERIGELLREIHYMVVPSLCYTNSPVVTFEAFARGVPVIVSNVGGAGEPVKQGENGFLFEPGNTESLYAALHTAYDHPDYTSLSCAARNSINGASVARYVQTLQSAILSL